MSRVRVWDNQKEELKVISQELADKDSARYYQDPDISALKDLEGKVDFSKLKLSNGKVVSKNKTEMRPKETADLLKVKANLLEKVDSEVTSNIRRGSFEYPDSSTNHFSLSNTDRLNLLSLFLIKDNISYPVSMYTKDNTVEYALTDSSDVAAMYDAAMVAVQSILASGAAAKKAINAASTKADAENAFNTYLTNN